LDYPYLSSFIKEFIRDLKGEGWDFTEKHKKLTGAVSQTELQMQAKTRKRRQQS
jgi:hypothetical protein